MTERIGAMGEFFLWLKITDLRFETNREWA